MSASSQTWALFTAAPETPLEKLTLFRLTCSTANDDPQADFTIEDLVSFCRSNEKDVRDALNGLVRQGFIAQTVKGQHDNQQRFTCHINFNLEDEYVF